MENKMLEELQGLIADLNKAEILSHIEDGTLFPWLATLRMNMGMLTAFLLESIQSQSD